MNSAPVITLYRRIAVEGERDSVRASLVLADAHGDTLVSLEAH